jgi:hypothetical protein
VSRPTTASLAYGGKGRDKLRNERLETQPERGKFAWLRSVQREHGIVMSARFLDVWQLRQEQAEVHVISPGVWLNGIHGKPADTEVERVIRAATQVYSLSSVKGKWHMGQLSLSGMAAP